MRASRYLRQMSLNEFLRKTRFRLAEATYMRWLAWRDQRYTTFAHTQHVSSAGMFPAPNVNHLRPMADQIRRLSARYLKHEFDLLGSGWVRVMHGMSCAGVEGFRYHHPADTDIVSRINPANQAESRRLRALIAPHYIPIDWQLDFKSGYRWSEGIYYRAIEYGHIAGVDIKVPWELARMQHLPQLAWAYALAKAGEVGFEVPETYAQEFRHQVLDFISANPPRWGVNWFVSMEVGIRAVNWLATYDFFKVYGAIFDEAFERALFRSLQHHAAHILTHLEYQSAWRTNHYLADVVCLLILGAGLSEHHDSDVWVRYGLHELLQEIQHQFYPDGSNCEASTAYHRLSGELVAYGLAAALSLDETRLSRVSQANVIARPLPVQPRAVTLDAVDTQRLWLMRQFMQDVTLPSGELVRIGDDDSGRLLKLFPVYRLMTQTQARETYLTLAHIEPNNNPYEDEICADARHLPPVIGALFGISANNDVEASLVACMIRHTLPPPESLSSAVPMQSWEEARTHAQQYPQHVSWTLEHPIASLWQGLTVRIYAQGGYVIYRSVHAVLTVRCGPVTHGGGHAHHDQLSITLTVNGVPLIQDVGTYLYTALVERRNAYRSVHAHFGPRVPDEPTPLVATFALEDTGAQIRHASTRGFYGTYHYHGGEVARLLTLTPNGLHIDDYASQGISLHPIVYPPQQPNCSPKYGSLLNL